MVDTLSYPSSFLVIKSLIDVYLLPAMYSLSLFVILYKFSFYWIYRLEALLKSKPSDSLFLGYLLGMYGECRRKNSDFAYAIVNTNTKRDQQTVVLLSSSLCRDDVQQKVLMSSILVPKIKHTMNTPNKRHT